eukprot:CAMPEP_0171280182 /NCGR_PEP_ID=MMETSP0790-20130122/65766_1 /TAXON_ID=2925 /ORGANISM="Alexandrium catenella, Strain OF101" /LENGTH=75 /DNA_ID=CAMNT_0011749389 /DNA_START=11 /DNA_END=234 /DNA_ORIENTATION=+
MTCCRHLSQTCAPASQGQISSSWPAAHFGALKATFARNTAAGTGRRPRFGILSVGTVPGRRVAWDWFSSEATDMG